MKIIQRNSYGAPELAVLHPGDHAADVLPANHHALAATIGTITEPTLYTRVTGIRDQDSQHAFVRLHGGAAARTAAALDPQPAPVGPAAADRAAAQARALVREYDDPVYQGNGFAEGIAATARHLLGTLEQDDPQTGRASRWLRSIARRLA